MGFFDFLRPTRTTEEVGVMIGRATLTTLTDNELWSVAYDPITDAGAPAHYNRITRELLYLLHFANHVAIGAATKDVDHTVEILQHATDLLVPRFQVQEARNPRSVLDPEPEHPPMAEEYLERKEELLTAFEHAPVEEGLAHGAHALVRVALAHISPTVDWEPTVEMPLVSLWMGQFEACRKAIKAVRIA